MVLAAGFGRRLRPLTDASPKALLEVGGSPLLAILLGKLALSGAAGVVVNVHHFAGRVEEFLRGGTWPEGWIRISRETEILGTGGGLRNAAPLLGEGDPVIVHNVDVLSNLPLRRLLDARRDAGASAVLAVQSRKTDRALAVDGGGFLCGRWGMKPARAPRGDLRPVAFNGISAIGPGTAGRLAGEGPFNLVDAYLRLAAAGETVRVFPMDPWYWADVGTPGRLTLVERDLGSGRISLDSLSG
ncbi:MAG: sugar phosphate nucleotidyltransferase [Candidatus Eisenbacteria bacterium]